MTEEYDYDAAYDPPPLADDVAALDRRALAARKAGRADEALALAEEAVRLADSGGVSLFWKMRPHARLATWLIQDGQTQRARELCHVWLRERRHPADRCKIFDALRRAALKERRTREALVLALCAALSWFDALRHREELLTPLLHDGPLAATVRAALKRARLEDSTDAVVALVLRLHEQGGEVSPERVEQALAAIGLTAPPADRPAP